MVGRFQTFINFSTLKTNLQRFYWKIGIPIYFVATVRKGSEDSSKGVFPSIDTYDMQKTGSSMLLDEM